MTEALWTPQEVADYFKLSKKNGSKTIIRWFRQGKLKGILLGRKTARFEKQYITKLNYGFRAH